MSPASNRASGVRFRARRVWGLCAAALFLALAAVGGRAEMRFKHHFVDRGRPADRIWASAAAADLDGDKRPDFIIGQAKWGAGEPRGVYWYRCAGRLDRWSDRRTVARGVWSGCGMTAFDVDRDGWTDVVTGGAWYRNPGPPRPGKPFERFEYGLGATAHDVVAHDVDGDGRPEVVLHVQGKRMGGVYVFTVPDDPTTKWPVARVAETGDRYHAAIAPGGVGDVSGDGRPDIVFLDRWFENPGPGGKPWPEHVNIDFYRKGKWGAAVRCRVADMDKDAHLDVVQAECDMPTARAAWFENVRGDGSAWTMHQLPDDRTPGDFHSLAVADFDLDGDPDVYVDEMEHLHVPPDREGRIGMIVWENLDGRGGRWRKHTLLTGLGGHQAKMADFDGDGDIDILTRPYKPHGNTIGGKMHVSALENLARRPDATGPGSGLTDGGETAHAAPAQTAAGTEPAGPARKPSEAGLVARWTFDDEPGGAARFDGTDDHIDAGNLELKGRALTLAARFKAEAFTGSGRDGRLLSKAVGTAEQDHYWMLSTWRVDRSVRLRFRLKAGGRTATLVADAGDLRPGVWVHAAAVYDGREMRLYKDGTLVGRTAKTGPVEANPQVTVWIGDNPPEAGSRPWHGLVDDVRLWRRALEPAEVRGLHRARPPTH